VEASEWTLSRRFGENQTIEGTLDLVALDASDHHVIIDLKWSSHKGYQERVDQGTALQLAAYHWLLTATRRVSKAGYFLLKNGQEIWMPTVGEDSPEGVWSWVGEAYQSRRRELNELARASGLDPGEGGDEPEKRRISPPCQFCEFEMLCGKGFDA
jgi:hypothetical protein